MITRDIAETDIDNGAIIINVINEDDGETLASIPEQKILSIPDPGEELTLREVMVNSEDQSEENMSNNTYTVEDRSHSYTVAQYEQKDGDIFYTEVDLTVSLVE